MRSTRQEKAFPFALPPRALYYLIWQVLTADLIGANAVFWWKRIDEHLWGCRFRRKDASRPHRRPATRSSFRLEPSAAPVAQRDQPARQSPDVGRCRQGFNLRSRMARTRRELPRLRQTLRLLRSLDANRPRHGRSRTRGLAIFTACPRRASSSLTCRLIAPSWRTKTNRGLDGEG